MLFTNLAYFILFTLFSKYSAPYLKKNIIGFNFSVSSKSKKTRNNNYYLINLNNAQ